MKLYFPLLLLCFILLSSSLMDPAMAQAKSGDCCDNCSKTCEVQDRCIKYEECKCLSSGTCATSSALATRTRRDIAVTSVQRGVQKQESKIDASSIVGYALKSASVCLMGIMATSMNAFATRTRRDIVVTSAQRGVQ